ncbi:MAG: UDP-N-acetylmuramate--L-alanine ligase [Patescibacteria group bacterium]|jgi:UDP-N-acetylmuramate--alanine ligase
MTLRNASSIHCIGISGIGLSAIAKWALENGKKVSGSDLQSQPVTEWLQAHGVAVAIGPHQAAHVPDTCDLVIRTVAAGDTNPEVQAAITRHIPLLTYPQAVGELMQGKVGIGIAGTHGKSTTTAMLAYILDAAKKDPTVIVGTRVALFGQTNERIGNGEEVLVEADEYQRAFFAYEPTHVAVLNVELDHVDVYHDLAEVREAFATFVARVPAHGSIALSAEDLSTPALRLHATGTVHTFGLSAGDLQVHGLSSAGGKTVFTFHGLLSETVTLQVPGEHNVLNALAAALVAHHLGIPTTAICQGLTAFPGTWRRFERRGTWQGADIVDDYAHHPTELTATLQAARQAFPGRRILCVFQPHQRSRTQALLPGFVQALRLADKQVILDIYDVAGREQGEAISSQEIVTALGESAQYARDVADAITKTQAILQPGDVVLTVGAGNITSFYDVATKTPSQ